jgi:hypothetical protein
MGCIGLGKIAFLGGNLASDRESPTAGQEEKSTPEEERR